MITHMVEKEDPWLSTDKIAKVVPLSMETIRAHIKNGDLPGKRFGKRYFVKQSTLLEWMEKSDYKQENFHSS